MIRVAAAEYDVQRPPDWARYAQRISAWVADAARQGAELLVFPEYAGLELGGFIRADRRLTPRTLFPPMQDAVADARDLHRDLARRSGVTIVAGSMPVAAADGRFVNRVHVFGPDGSEGHQDKLQLTRVEHRMAIMSPGSDLHVFDLAGLRFGISLCYDSQFPLLGHALAKAGADVILTPSCTHAETGFNRVRIGCRARSLENQCYTLQSVLVGDVPWFPIMATNVGRAGVFSPPDDGLPDDGILADGAEARPGWLITDLAPERTRRLRGEGQVGNFDDWERQYPAVAKPAGVVPLQRGGR